eukprot:COSAG06_NODE_1471_length_9351_cov_18.052637_2_plen_138_part_00
MAAMLNIPRWLHTRPRRVRAVSAGLVSVETWWRKVLAEKKSRVRGVVGYSALGIVKIQHAGTVANVGKRVDSRSECLHGRSLVPQPRLLVAAAGYAVASLPAEVHRLVFFDTVRKQMVCIRTAFVRAEPYLALIAWR